MGIKETLSSFADRLNFKSEEPRDAQYDDQYGYDSDYQDEYVYEDQSDDDQRDGQYEFEQPSYGSGYTSAGVRPVSKSKGASKGRSLLDRMRGVPEPSRATTRKPDNVIPMSQSERQYVRDDGRYEEDTQALSPRVPRGYDDGYYDEEEPQHPARAMRAQTMIYLVRRLEDAEDIITHMLRGGFVIINMEEIDDAMKRRVLDVISGAAYALASTVRKISYHNYYVAPQGEEVVTNSMVREQPYDEGGYRSGRDRNGY